MGILLSDDARESRRINSVLEGHRPAGSAAAEGTVETTWLALVEQWKALEGAINAHEADQRPALALFEGQLHGFLRLIEAWWETVPAPAQMKQLNRKLAWLDKAERAQGNIRRMRDRRGRAEA
jgi:hypothetical protein